LNCFHCNKIEHDKIEHDKAYKFTEIKSCNKFEESSLSSASQSSTLSNTESQISDGTYDPRHARTSCGQVGREFGKGTQKLHEKNYMRSYTRTPLPPEKKFVILNSCENTGQGRGHVPPGYATVHHLLLHIIYLLRSLLAAFSGVVGEF
jgi:hypothetical protein